MKQNKVLITGGTGFIGKKTVNKIAQKNLINKIPTEIHILTRNLHKNYVIDSDINTPIEIKYFPANLVDLSSLPSDSYDLVIHAASPSSAERFDGETTKFERFRSVVIGTERLINALGSCKISKFLFLSSGAVYGNTYTAPPNELSKIATLTTSDFAFYSEAKRAAETMCILGGEKYKFKINIARIFATVGSGMYLEKNSNYIFSNFIENSYEKNAYKIKGNPYSRRSFLDIKDCVDALLVIIDSNLDREVFNIGSDEVLSLEELAHKFNEALGLELMVDLSGASFDSEPSHLYPDISKIKSFLQWRPSVNLDTTISKTFEYYQRMVEGKAIDFF